MRRRFGFTRAFLTDKAIARVQQRPRQRALKLFERCGDVGRGGGHDEPVGPPRRLLDPVMGSGIRARDTDCDGGTVTSRCRMDFGPEGNTDCRG